MELSAEIADWVRAIAELAIALTSIYGLTVVRRVEKNTNSLTQQLVDSTATKSHAEGMLEERNKEKL
jgi:hypothetical protein